jgi:hypothetical protein
MEADSTQPIATPVDRFEKFLASQNGCFPNERPCKSCAIAFAASETAALTQQVADLKAENAALVVARDAFDKAWTEEKAEVARLREGQDHAKCHDVACNADRRRPRGERSVSCSCAGREKRMMDALQTVFSKAVAFQPDSIGENPILYRWVGEIKDIAREALGEKHDG